MTCFYLHIVWCSLTDNFCNHKGNYTDCEILKGEIRDDNDRKK